MGSVKVYLGQVLVKERESSLLQFFLLHLFGGGSYDLLLCTDTESGLYLRLSGIFAEDGKAWRWFEDY
jgi:hypothetical protein